MSTYQDRKERAREKAIEWQLCYGDESHYMSEDASDTEYFRKLAKRYGLTKEFAENGII